MTNEELIAKVTHFVQTSPDNHVSAKDAIYPELAGLKMYDAPIFGFAAADDTLFTETFKREGVIHPAYMAPAEWLGGCKTVISFFLPFTAAVRESNRGKTDEPYAPDISLKCSAANAIDKEKGCALGKDQNVCGACLQESHLPPHGPNQRVRYGCGKCQVGTPCESGIPK